MIEKIGETLESDAGGEALAPDRQALTKAVGDLGSMLMTLMSKMRESVYHVGLQGNRVLFASNWSLDCGGGCGTASNIKDYVVWSPGALGGVDTPGPEPASESGIALSEIRPNPSDRLPAVVYSLPSWAPATLELLDVAGRRVLWQDLGTPGPGSHALGLELHPSPGAGVYWLRLRQSGHAVSRSIVLTR